MLQPIRLVWLSDVMYVLSVSTTKLTINHDELMQSVSTHDDTRDTNLHAVATFAGGGGSATG